MRQKQQTFDLTLFLELNEEYKDKPIVPRPRQFGKSDLEGAALRRASYLDKLLGVGGKRVLEIGCGRGEFSYILARDYDCDVVGVDLVERGWGNYKSLPNLDLRILDVSAKDHDDVGQFDLIYSSSVWEHIRHPFAALQGAKRVLKGDGSFFLSANLYRGPQASHRYREVFFPWPHLLFSDDIFKQFYGHIGKSPKGPAWVNKLTYSEYKNYFEILGLHAREQWFSSSALDEDFYSRFEDILSRYPKSDLKHNFLNAILVHDRTLKSELGSPTSLRSRIMKPESDVLGQEGTTEGLGREIEVLRSRITKLERSLKQKRFELHRSRTSIRWRLGSLLVDSVRKPWRLARLPFDLLRLSADYRQRKNVCL